MARRIVSVTTISPTPTADATNLVDATYPFILQGGNATQLNRIHEISLSGQSSASSGPMYMLLARDSTIAVTNSAGAGQTDAPLDTATIAPYQPGIDRQYQHHQTAAFGHTPFVELLAQYLWWLVLLARQQDR